MAIKKSQLYSTLWKGCDELRGGMDASQYKDYVLTMLFWKYISDKAKSDPDSMIFEIPEGCTFDDIVKIKNRSDIGDQLNKKLEKIGKEFELGEGFFHSSDFNDPKKLGSGKDMVDTLSGLISVFENPALDFGQNRAADDDLIGDAYEYLMRNFAQKSGKSKGQFYTPAEASRLAAALLDIKSDTRDAITIYDMTCGSGSLLLRAANESRASNTSLYGQDKDIATVHMAKLNMILHGMVGYEDLREGDTLNAPHHTDPNFPDNRLMRFDYCVANPPYSVKNWRKSAMEADIYGRWNPDVTGLPPNSKGDLAFLLHMIRSMKSDGRGSCFLPHGVLFRGSVDKGEGEAMVRKYLVDHHLISGIIGLPPNIFYGTGIPTCIVVIDKRAANDSKGIFMINAKDGFRKDGDKNRLREQDIRLILDTWEAKRDVPHYAKLATWDEIIANGYNLNIPRYVTPADTEVQHNLEAHIHGGIPMADIEQHDNLWSLCPSLKSTIFQPIDGRPDFMEFTDAAEKEIESTIEADTSYRTQLKNYSDTINAWVELMANQLDEVKVGCVPRLLIEKWGRQILELFMECRSLVDAYDAYDQLMQYWEEALQDDAYMISRDGWKPTVSLPLDKKGNIKKSYSYPDIACDLLPSGILAKVHFPEVLADIAETETLIESLGSDMSSLVEENADSFSDFMSENSSIINAKLNAALKLAAKNPQEYDAEDVKLWKEYKALTEKLDAAKKTLKSFIADITEKVYKKYQTITEEEVRNVVFHDKWMNTMRTRLDALMSDAQQHVSAELKDLEARYANTLGALTADVTKLETSVLNHLKAMGIEL